MPDLTGLVLSGTVSWIADDLHGTQLAQQTTGHHTANAIDLKDDILITAHRGTISNFQGGPL